MATSRPPLIEGTFTTASVFHAAGDVLFYRFREGHVYLVVPMITCVAFATELFLKCLLLIENRPFGRSHDLYGLFGKLTEDSQEAIKGCCAQDIARDAQVRAHIHQ